MKELEWSLWYCRRRQTVPSAQSANLRYWSGVEDRVQAALALPIAAKHPQPGKKKVTRGLSSIGDLK